MPISSRTEGSAFSLAEAEAGQNHLEEESELVPCYKRNTYLKGAERSEIPLPSTGEKPTSCDGWYVPKFCRNCGQPVLRKGNCKRAICPDCATSWRFQRAEKIHKRIDSYRYQKNKRVRHFVLSPEDYLVEKLVEGKIDYEYLFKEAIKTIKWKSPENYGGFILVHPYRITKEGKEKAKKVKEEKDGLGKGEIGDWKALLNLEDWREYVYFYPHLHAILTTDRGKGWKKGDRKRDGGFLFEGIREVKAGGDVLKLSMYLLSHLGLISEIKNCNSQSTRWFGNLSGAKWSFEQADRSVKIRVNSEYRKIQREYEEKEDFAKDTCLDCGGELIFMSDLPEHIQKFDAETSAQLQRIWLLQSSDKDPPKTPETEEEFIEWVNEEYSHVKKEHFKI